MRSNVVAAKLFMWILVLLTPITVGAFVYLCELRFVRTSNEQVQRHTILRS